MPDFKKLAESLKKRMGKDYKLAVLVLLGLSGMVLVLLSQFAGGSSSTPAVEEPAAEQYTAEEYIEKLEEKLTELITGMEGVGRAQVMVTLENGGEMVYVQEEKRNTDMTTEPGEGGDGGKISRKENVERSYIMVETSYGQKEPLVQTQLQPKIQGVVIVCEGADDIRVEQSLINVTTTALGISSTRVCVVKIN